MQKLFDFRPATARSHATIAEGHIAFHAAKPALEAVRPTASEFIDAIAKRAGIDAPQSAAQLLDALDARLAAPAPTTPAAQTTAPDALYDAAWGARDAAAKAWRHA